MSLAINLNPTLSHQLSDFIDSLTLENFSRILTGLTKTTAFKVGAEIATLITVFTAAVIWMFVF